MRAGHRAEFFGAGEPNEIAEVFQVALVGAMRARIINIGKPFHCSWHARQLLELYSGQPALTDDEQCASGAAWQLVFRK